MDPQQSTAPCPNPQSHGPETSPAPPTLRTSFPPFSNNLWTASHILTDGCPRHSIDLTEHLLLKHMMRAYPRATVEQRCNQLLRTTSFGSKVPFDIYVQHPDLDPWVSTMILRKGQWGKLKCDKVQEMVRKLDTGAKGKPIYVMDVGAHIGFLSFWAASSSPRVRVMAVEAHQDHFELLEKTLKMERNERLARRITLHPLALSDTKEIGKHSCLKTTPNNSASTFLDPSLPPHSPNCTATPTTTLDTLLLLSSHPISILLLDVEGLEPLILSGASSLLSHHRPKLILLTYRHKALSESIARLTRSSVFRETKDPVDFVVQLVEMGYSYVEDLHTRVGMKSVEEVKGYFGGLFWEKMKSGQTDLAFCLPF
ncbi:hypothetical protein HK097_004391 [Rhizophlyctis rosea]|uniref:Methyltransferase FkbM domain-containing protein n=1 Tax=Rhizophlyctis rosea TaxID=64517 RepID=A0AAD5S1H7_9FUNG|nr:hypothetical protein HK097_004391 [Rhizophlyctis rosea]